MSRGSSVSIVTGYVMGYRVYIPGRGSNFLFCHHIQTGALPPFYIMGTGGSYVNRKAD
jgi:hypothetical protein